MENEFPKMKSLKEIRMHESERLLMREKLSSLADAKPVMVKNIPSPFMNSFAIFAKATSFALLGIIVSTSSLTAMAKNSLPGDLLFGIKTGIYEKISDTRWIGGDISKLAWYTGKLENRISEMEKLSKQESTLFAKTVATREFIKTTRDIKDTLTKISFTGNKEIIETNSGNVLAMLEKYVPKEEPNIFSATEAMTMRVDMKMMPGTNPEIILDPIFQEAIRNAKVIIAPEKRIETTQNIIDAPNEIIESIEGQEVKSSPQTKEVIIQEKPIITEEQQIETPIETGVENSTETGTKYDPTKSTQ